MVISQSTPRPPGLNSKAKSFTPHHGPLYGRVAVVSVRLIPVSTRCDVGVGSEFVESKHFLPSNLSVTFSGDLVYGFVTLIVH